MGGGRPGQVPPGGYTPWAGTPPQAGTPPTQCMLRYGQQAVGTHPTGMRSCFSKMKIAVGSSTLS